MNRKEVRTYHITQLILILLVVAAVNFIASHFFFRIDMTEEQRYSLSETSRDNLKELDDILFVKVYLSGNDLPPGFVKLKRSIREKLDDFRMYTDKLEYEFIDITEITDEKDRFGLYDQLRGKGLVPTQISEKQAEKYSSQWVFPGAVMSYKDREETVNFLVNEGNAAVDPDREKAVNSSISRLEQHLVQAIIRLRQDSIPKIAFIEGHGELDAYQTMDIMLELADFYKIERLKVDGVLGALDGYEAVVIAKPIHRFSEKDKFIIDQYIMNGGKVLWMVEWMRMSMDSLAEKPSSLALIQDLNLDDQLFNYGVRINPDLVQDLNCLSIPVVVSEYGGKPKFEPKPWCFFPAIVSKNTHMITRNMNVLRTQFVSSLDTVGEDPGIKKKFLLHTSPYSRSLMAPVNVSLKILREPPDPKTFIQGAKPIAVLLEGVFTSNFMMRIPPEIALNQDIGFKEKSKSTKQIVVADGDLMRNYVQKRGEKRTPYNLGEDKYYPEQYTPGNKEFALNAVNYLCGDEELIELRMREIKMRLLDKARLKEKQQFWIVFNTIAPVLLLGLLGLVFFLVRQHTYIKKSGL